MDSINRQIREARRLRSSLRWLQFCWWVELVRLGVLVAVSDWAIAHQQSVLLSLECLGIGGDRL